MRSWWPVGVGCSVLLLASCNEVTGIGKVQKTDIWAQAPTDQVDILWVIDNSTSMKEEQALLAEGFSSFIAGIDDQEVDVDFHLGVITTDFESDSADRGRFVGEPAVITTDDEFVTLFEDRSTGIGTGGSGMEKGLDAAVYALSPLMTTGPNAGFLREEANLLVVFVSDEDDCSDAGRLGAEAQNTACYLERDKLVPVQDYVSKLRDLKPRADMVQIAAIVGPESPPTQACDDNSLPGFRYIQAARLTGGLTASICETDWSDVLEDLGLNAVGIFTEYQLTFGAAAGTLVVTVDGEVAEFLGYIGDVEPDENGVGPITLEQAALLDGYVYDVELHMITFFGAWVPQRGAEVKAVYTVEGGT